MIEKIDRYYLQILSDDIIYEKLKPSENYKIELASPSNFELNKFFYKQIGKKHQWIDRLNWTNHDWVKYVKNKNLKTFVLKKNGDLVGFFELILNNEIKESEIAYLGILEEYFGNGCGGYLLTKAIKKSFELGAKRVWVHTCSLDHPNAIQNYKSRGMKVFRTEILERKAV